MTNEYLSSTLLQYTCDVCGSKEFDLQEDLVAVPNLANPDKGVPAKLVSCCKCGKITLFRVEPR